MMNLSDSLKRFRKYANITQKQAAQGANVSERNYQAYEYGKVITSATVLIALADSFDVSLDYLVGRSDDPERHYNGAEYTPASRMLARKIGTLSESEQKAVLVFIDAMDGLKKAFSQDGKD